MIQKNSILLHHKRSTQIKSRQFINLLPSSLCIPLCNACSPLCWGISLRSRCAMIISRRVSVIMPSAIPSVIMSSIIIPPVIISPTASAVVIPTASIISSTTIIISTFPWFIFVKTSWSTRSSNVSTKQLFPQISSHRPHMHEVTVPSTSASSFFILPTCRFSEIRYWGKFYLDRFSCVKSPVQALQCPSCPLFISKFDIDISHHMVCQVVTDAQVFNLSKFIEFQENILIKIFEKMLHLFRIYRNWKSIWP